jgi:predicted HTH transcriptional regulator
MTTESARDRTANPFKEQFARFLEEPSREALRALLRDHLGEFDECDFKVVWPAPGKAARIVLAMANSGGGVVVFGVKQLDDGGFDPVGLTEIEDKTTVLARLDRFLPRDLHQSLNLSDFTFKDSEYGHIKGKSFQVLTIKDDPEHLPFVAESEGDDILPAVVYVRRNTASVPANHDELQRLINRRIETGHSSTHEMELQRHFDELRLLFNQVDRYLSMTTGEQLLEAFLPKNRHYPKEDFNAFVARLIGMKKAYIEGLIKIPKE